MPRKTKAERERIKVTCLWCENEARTHLICAACMAPMTDDERKQYIRVLPISTPKTTSERARACRDRRLSAGLCIHCGQPSNTQPCTQCKMRHNTARAARTTIRRLERMPTKCKACGSPIESRRKGQYKRFCSNCKDSRAMRPRIGSIVCACGTHVSVGATKHKKRCDRCTKTARRTSAKQKRDIAKANGICTRCLEEPISKTSICYCERCLITERGRYVKTTNRSYTRKKICS